MDGDGAVSPIGQLLRGHRLAAGLSQQEVAERAGVSLRALRDLEQGRTRQPRARAIGGLADALRLSAAERAALVDTLTAGRSAAGSSRVGVLGPVQVIRDGRPAAIPSLRQRTMLGLFALHHRQVVTTDDVIDVVWGDDPPRTVRNLVQACVSDLRALLGSAGRSLRLANGGYCLSLPGQDLDLDRFDDLVARARTAGSAGQAAALFAQALSCWRGPVVADTDDRLRGHPAAVAAGRRRIAATVAFADVAIAQGDGELVIGALRALSHEDPLHEAVHGRLMLALAATGEQAAALRLYAELRLRLADELGVEPGAEVQAAHLRVLRAEAKPGRIEIDRIAAPAKVSAGPAARLPDRAPGAREIPRQLPAKVASFAGRREEMAALDGLLARMGETGPAAAGGIAVIAGTAGVGKTALATCWAHLVRERFPHGQLYADLRGFTPRTAPLRPIEVLTRFLRALGKPDADIPAELDSAVALFRTVTADRRLLILLDNARDADQVRPLLPGGPGCLVLITGRDRLAGLVAQEGAIPVRLDVLTPKESTVLLSELLGPATAAAQPDTVARLAELCEHLPLALRIAAANLATRPAMTLDEYVAALSTGDRLAELAFVEDPQAGVAATFDLSYAALPKPAARLFRLIGLAPCHCVDAPSVAALAGVTPAVAAGLLGVLASAHLLEEQAYGRYSCHDLLRHYAAGLALGESGKDEALTRLYAYYLGHADAATELQYAESLRLLDPAGFPSSEASFPDKQTAAAWLKTEARNLFAVIGHTAEHGPRQVSWLLADAMRGYFWLHPETIDLLAIAATALSAAEADGDPRGQAACHRSLGTIHRTLTHFDEAVRRHRLAIALSRRAGWISGEVAALDGLATVYWHRNQFRRSVLPFQRALRLSRGEGHAWNTAVLLHNLATIHYGLGDLRRSHDCLTEAVKLRRELGSRAGEAFALSELAEREHQLGRPGAALTLLAEAMPIHEQLQDFRGQNMVLRRRAAVHRDTGRLDLALHDARAAVELASTLDHLWENAHAVHTLGTVENLAGDPSHAVDLQRQALKMAQDMGTRHFEAEVLIGLARAHHRLGEPADAVAQASKALAIAVEGGFRLLETQARQLL